jgi:hypothetical protein
MDPAGSGRRELAPPMPCNNRGPRIRGHHPLDLEPQIVLRAAPQCAMPAHDLDPGPAACIDQQDVVGVLAREAIGRMAREPVDRARRSEITPAFQGWPHEGGPTLAVIQTRHRLGHRARVRRDTLAQCRALAGNRLGRGLAFRRDAGGDCRLERRHAASLLLTGC